MERVAYRLDGRSGPEPDIGYVGPDKLEHVLPGYVAGAPDVAIEIVSKDSGERDYVTKRAKYEKAGVGEYWIIDPLQEKATSCAWRPIACSSPFVPATASTPARSFRASGFVQSGSGKALCPRREKDSERSSPPQGKDK